jgi:hypothetical protein
LDQADDAPQAPDDSSCVKRIGLPSCPRYGPIIATKPGAVKDGMRPELPAERGGPATVAALSLDVPLVVIASCSMAPGATLDVRNRHPRSVIPSGSMAGAATRHSRNRSPSTHRPLWSMAPCATLDERNRHPRSVIPSGAACAVCRLRNRGISVRPREIPHYAALRSE